MYGSRLESIQKLSCLYEWRLDSCEMTFCLVRFRKQLKVAMATRMETQSDFLEYMGVASLLGGDVHSFDDLAAAIDKVTVADVEEVSVDFQIF